MGFPRDWGVQPGRQRGPTREKRRRVRPGGYRLKRFRGREGRQVEENCGHCSGEEPHQNHAHRRPYSQRPVFRANPTTGKRCPIGWVGPCHLAGAIPGGTDSSQHVWGGEGTLIRFSLPVLPRILSRVRPSLTLARVLLLLLTHVDVFVDLEGLLGLRGGRGL